MIRWQQLTKDICGENETERRVGWNFKRLKILIVKLSMTESHFFLFLLLKLVLDRLRCAKASLRIEDFAKMLSHLFWLSSKLNFTKYSCFFHNYFKQLNTNRVHIRNCFNLVFLWLTVTHLFINGVNNIFLHWKLFAVFEIFSLYIQEKLAVKFSWKHGTVLTANFFFASIFSLTVGTCTS